MLRFVLNIGCADWTVNVPDENIKDAHVDH